MKLLFVCTGNTCRSAMAEPLMRRRLDTAGLGDRVEVRSAGVAAMPGAPASQGAAHVLNAKGMDGAGHMASLLDRELVNWADLILTMGESHKRAIVEKHFDALDKTFTLKEFVDDDPANLAILDAMAQVQEAAQLKQGQFLQDHADEVEALQARYQAGDASAAGDLEQLQARLEASVKAESQQMVDLMGKLPSYDIADPYGGPQSVYDATAAEIDVLLEKLVQRLQEEL
ncbi:protein-tyrosine phosphatase [Tumebacillus sp. BK434]|uniref:low molecular weight protein arginine phosphatase n=1 Tax=Tumebacillus sp. BK434 TaxID=2512169 RepID=UPI0010EDB64A|nr:low molecular weight protein arginine phosphatase [Tumebacillus sp. BK434]TCP57722.1 protein-tyrosine phosphatase [Tumebacillus sp. BK434]